MDLVAFVNKEDLNQGPVVQRVVSLTSSVGVIFVNCFSGLNIQYSDIFC